MKYKIIIFIIVILMFSFISFAQDIPCVPIDSPEGKVVVEVVKDIGEGGYSKARENFNSKKQQLLDDLAKKIESINKAIKSIEADQAGLDERFRTGDIESGQYYHDSYDLDRKTGNLNRQIDEIEAYTKKSIGIGESLLKTFEPEKPRGILEKRKDTDMIRALGTKAATDLEYQSNIFGEYVASNRMTDVVKEIDRRMRDFTFKDRDPRYSVYNEDSVRYIESEAKTTGYKLTDGFIRELQNPRLPELLHIAILRELKIVGVSFANLEKLVLVGKTHFKKDGYNIHLLIYKINGKKISILVREGEISATDFETQQHYSRQGIAPTPLIDDLMTIDGRGIIIEQFPGRTISELSRDIADGKLGPEEAVKAAKALADLYKKIHRLQDFSDGKIGTRYKDAAANEHIDGYEARATNFRVVDVERVSVVDFYHEKFGKILLELGPDAFAKHLDETIAHIDETYRDQPSITITDTIPEGATSATINSVLGEGYTLGEPKTHNSNGLSLIYSVRQSFWEAGERNNKGIVGAINEYFKTLKEKTGQTIKGVDLNPNFGKRKTQTFDRNPIDYRNLFVDLDKNTGILKIIREELEKKGISRLQLDQEVARIVKERLQKSNTELEKDGHLFVTDSGKVKETRIALALEAEGKLKGPVTRPDNIPPYDGHADFIDGDKKLWDVKGFESSTKDAGTIVGDIKAEIANGQNVIIDATNLDPDIIRGVYERINNEKVTVDGRIVDMRDHVLWYNPPSP